MHDSGSWLRYLRYALPGLPLAALMLPFYIYVPLWLSEHGNYGYTLVGALFFIARISDVLTDLPVGAWIDRKGCGAPWWLSSWFLLAVSALVLFLLPHPWPAWALLLVLVLLMLGWTGINVPWLALPVSLARNNGERLAYNSAREAMLLFGTLVAMLLPGILSPDALRWMLMPMLGFLLFTALLQGRHKGVTSSHTATSIWPLIKEPRVLSLALPWCINMLANAIPGTILVLFMREVLVAEDAVPAALLVYFLSGLIGVPFWYALARRIGSLTAWRLGLCLSALLFGFAALLGEGDLYWFIAICVGTGLMLGADQALPSAMQTGLAQSLASNGGNKDMGARLFALWSMLSKGAMGIAVGVAYLWLGSQTSMENVPPAWAISSAYVLAPVLLKMVVFFMLGQSSLAWLAKEWEHEETAA
ncbi:Na+/melibiose symporter-like transporter [Spongiibacter sp. IMCC21906]|uniref:MFS transporter n=1 Tax=Spongiibacter sp. IMCC21906 TaxID=1620392 RepID=UPI00062DFB88|nr:MFS transporter [Spongiibacter sp. IMCC21906]AKH68286.1 Na+/melibiose symporter-like transporter [Spongiibacter sp. IMCC21906]